VPRFYVGAFLTGFKHLYKNYHGYDPEIIENGTPHLAHMQFTQDQVLQKSKDVKNIYMIGSNHQTDILGSNNISEFNSSKDGLPKWVSIAVKTGLFQNSAKNQGEIKRDSRLKPHHIVDNF